jgi:hypothetical protein
MSEPTRAPETPEPIDPVLEALWQRVTEAWDDEKAHAALLDHALRAQQLPELSGRYRALVGDRDRGAAARKHLDAIVTAATQMLMSMKTPPANTVPLPITLSAVGVCVLLLSWLAYALWGPR